MRKTGFKHSIIMLRSDSLHYHYTVALASFSQINRCSEATKALQKSEVERGGQSCSSSHHARPHQQGKWNAADCSGHAE